MQKTAARSIDKTPGNAIDPALEGDVAKRLLADMRELARKIATRAPEIEQQRRVPWDIIDSLRACGLFKVLVPRSHGGLGLGFPEVLPAITALSAADGSVGWVSMIASSSQLFCSRLPRALYDELFENGAGRYAGRPGRKNRRRLQGHRALAVCQRLRGRAMDPRSLRDLR